MQLLITLVLTVRLYDIAGLPDGTWHDAVALASTTLERAGIDTQWTNCGTAVPAASRCQKELSADELVLRVRHAPLRRGALTLGDAVVDTRAHAGTVATIYANRIAATAVSSGVDASVVLGRALAHEVGHLLLGSPDHPPTGLMRAHWTSAELRGDVASDWRFSETEAEIMRVGLVRRAAPTLAPTDNFTTIRVPRCRPTQTDSRPRATMRTRGPSSPCGCSRASLSWPEPPPWETSSGMQPEFTTRLPPEFSTACSF